MTDLSPAAENLMIGFSADDIAEMCVEAQGQAATLRRDLACVHVVMRVAEKPHTEEQITSAEQQFIRDTDVPVALLEPMALRVGALLLLARDEVPRG